MKDEGTATSNRIEYGFPWSIFKEVNQRKKNNKLLKRYFKISDKLLCHWCRKPIYKSSGVVTVNTATVDHIISKNDIRRGLTTYDTNTVLSCWECNDRRAQEEEIALRFGYEVEVYSQWIDIRTLIK